MLNLQHFTNSFKPYHPIKSKLLTIHQSINNQFRKKVSSLDLQKKSTNPFRQNKLKQVAYNFISINQTSSKFLPFKPLKQHAKSMPHKDQIVSSRINNISQLFKNNIKTRKSSSLELRLYTTLNFFSTNQNLKKPFFPIKKCSVSINDLENLQADQELKNITNFKQQNNLIKQQSIKNKQKNHRFLFKKLEKQQNVIRTNNKQPFKNSKKFKIRKVSYAISPWEANDY